MKIGKFRITANISFAKCGVSNKFKFYFIFSTTAFHIIFS